MVQGLADRVALGAVTPVDRLVAVNRQKDFQSLGKLLESKFVE